MIPGPVAPPAVPIAAGDAGMNILKEELPGEREGRFRAFVLKAPLYAAVLPASSWSHCLSAVSEPREADG